MGSELKAFLLRGNVVDLAVAVVIGAAFTAIVTAIVTGLITPLIALLVGQPDASGLNFQISGTQFLLGDVIEAVINFLIVGLILFLIVRAINRLVEARRDEATDEVTIEETPEEIVLLREIRDRLGAGAGGQGMVPPPTI
jgi:large conductance mechanosensitive channel